ncbi:MAG: hypothetical protein ACK5D7_13405 [Planctomycetota bacterium]
MASKTAITFAAALLLLCGPATDLARGQAVAPTEQPKPPTPQPQKYTLRWKFQPGEIIKVEQKFDTQYLMRKESLLLEYKYYWVVRAVEKSGDAKIGIVFEDLSISDRKNERNYQASAEDKSNVDNQRNERSPLIYEARTLLQSEVELLVTPDGGTGILRGAASLPNIRMFTPGDLPGLPERSVAVGESWRVPVGIQAISGEATSTLAKVEEVEGRQIALIETVVNWGQMAQQYQHDLMVQVEPSKVVARFDIEAGKFLEEENGMKMKVLAPQKPGQSKSDPPKTVETVSMEIERRLSAALAAPSSRPMNGEYVLAFAQDQFKSVVLAGERMLKPTDPPLTTREMMNVHFYHDWEDSDGDNSPMSWELKDINRRFTADETIRCLITMLGMENRRVRMDIVDGFGNELHSNAIPIKSGPASFAGSETELPEGIYFYEFFIDNQFELRVPVHVVPGK